MPSRQHNDKGRLFDDRVVLTAALFKTDYATCKLP